MHRLSLDGVWAKVERAKEHADALQDYTDKTFAVETDRPRLGAKFDAERGQNILFINEMPDLTAFFTRASLIVGDSIHALRCALDHLVFQLALRETGPSLNEWQTQFPIIDDPAKWGDARRRWLGQVSANDQATIERYQPYHRVGNVYGVRGDYRPLAMLRDLDDVDKHRLLNTVVVPRSSMSTTLYGPGAGIGLLGMFDRFQGTPTDFTVEKVEAIELGTVVGRSTSSAKYLGPIQGEVEVAGYVSPKVSIAGERLANEVLDILGATVAQVIREFEPFP